jgi:oxalate decarboxylase/phosphoglucose isomerase-like protein (cupin superfamily)
MSGLLEICRKAEIGVPHRVGYQAGDVGYVPKSMPRYIENTGTTALRYLELWQSDHFADVSLAQWLAFTPFDLVQAHLHIDKSVLAKVSTEKTPIVGANRAIGDECPSARPRPAAESPLA